MITILTSVLPIALGFFAKLMALSMQAKQENQKLQMEVLMAREASIDSARTAAATESPMAALNRRLIIWVMLALIVTYVLAPLFIDVPTAIPIVQEGFSILGIQITPDVIEYQMVRGLIKYDEVFAWTSLIIEMYFGASMAKGK